LFFNLPWLDSVAQQIFPPGAKIARPKGVESEVSVRLALALQPYSAGPFALNLGGSDDDERRTRSQSA
jgi:hypothetical protein